MKKCSDKVEAADSIQERLKHVFEALDITIYQVAKKLGENPSKFYNILNGRAKPSYDTILSLLACYPQISSEFLLRGIPPVLTAANNEGDQNSRFVSGDSTVVELPFVPVRFYASFVETYTEGLRNQDLGTYRVRRDAVRTNKPVVVIEVAGNSMSPQLANGAKVLAELVDRNDWEYQSGGVYAVIYRDYFVVKRIKDNELLTRKFLTLHSDNPNGGSVTIPLSDIRGIWKVVSIVDALVE